MAVTDVKCSSVADLLVSFLRFQHLLTGTIDIVLSSPYIYSVATFHKKKASAALMTRTIIEHSESMITFAASLSMETGLGRKAHFNGLLMTSRSATGRDGRQHRCRSGASQCLLLTARKRESYSQRGATEHSSMKGSPRGRTGHGQLKLADCARSSRRCRDVADHARASHAETAQRRRSGVKYVTVSGYAGDRSHAAYWRQP